MKKSKVEDMEMEVGGEHNAAEEKSEPKEIHDQEVEMALEDFMRVAKHKKNSKLMEKLLGKAEEKKKAIESIEDLKMARNEAFKPKN